MKFEDLVLWLMSVTAILFHCGAVLILMVLIVVLVIPDAPLVTQAIKWMKSLLGFL